MTTVANTIAQHLNVLGVTHVFGMPGGASLPLLEAFRKQGIDFILVRQEASAGFMADAIYQRTGNIGACLSTLGPGATNLLSGIAQAYLERSRVIGIVGQISASLYPIYTHQILNQRAMFLPLCKDYYELHPERVDAQLRNAFRCLQQGRPGPIVIEVTKETAESRCDFFSPEKPPQMGVPAADSAHILLLESNFPILFVGAEDLSLSASLALTKWSEQSGIPVITTYRAKGMLSEQHPNSIGSCGLSPVVDQLQQKFLQRADLLITVGLDPVELRPNWLPGWPSTMKVLNISSTGQPDLVTEFTLDLRGDIAEIIKRCSTVSSSKWIPTEFIEHRQQIEAIFNDGPYGPASMIQTLQQTLPDNTVISLDVGAHRITASHVWKCTDPRQMLQSNGLSSMGVGLAMGIACKLLQPDTPCLVLSGDMGLWMSLGELGIIQERQLDIIVVYLADRSLSLIELKQERMDNSQYGVSFDNPDPISLAKAFGGTGHITNSTTELEELLPSLPKGFHLIEARIDPSFYRQQM